MAESRPARQAPPGVPKLHNLSSLSSLSSSSASFHTTSSPTQPPANPRIQGTVEHTPDRTPASATSLSASKVVVGGVDSPRTRCSGLQGTPMLDSPRTKTSVVSSNMDSPRAFSQSVSLSGTASAQTVAMLGPQRATVLSETVTIYQAANVMATNRVDAILLSSAQSGGGSCVGILTDRDVLRRVVCRSLDPTTTQASAVMTSGVTCATPDDPATEALGAMVRGRFRHLPVVDRTAKGGKGGIVGLLDITKCLKGAVSALDAVEGGPSRRRLSGLISHLERQLSQDEQDSKQGVDPLMTPQAMLESLRGNIKRKTVGMLLSENELDLKPLVSIKATVDEAANTMMDCNSGGVLVMLEGQRKLVGIFTSKDILFRVIAGGLSTSSTKMQDVMTLIPETISPSTSITDALQLMHSRKFLHLPVVDDESLEVIGLVDVLQLTLSVMETTAKGDLTGEAEDLDEDSAPCPAWEVFWASNMAAPDDDRSSVHSAESEPTVSALPVHNPTAPLPAFHNAASPIPAGDNGNPKMAQSAKPPLGLATPRGVVTTGLCSRSTCMYKVKGAGGRCYRFRSSAVSLEAVKAVFLSRMFQESSPDLQQKVNVNQLDLVYLDNEGDCVTLTDDEDLKHAVELALKWGAECITLQSFSSAPGQPQSDAQSDISYMDSHDISSRDILGSVAPGVLDDIHRSPSGAESTRFALDLSFRPNWLVVFGLAGTAVILASYRMNR